MSSEPRLTTLLIDPASLLLGTPKRTSQSSLQLPPLQDPSPSRTSTRPLPLEPSTTASKDVRPATSNLSSHSKAKATNIGEATVRHKESRDADILSRSVSPPGRILNCPTTSTGLEPDSGPRKRQRLDGAAGLGKYVQLPKPPQKGKKPPNLPIPAPTVVNGLNAPPPSAALFPPITPSSFHDAHGRNALNTTTTAPESIKTSKQPRKNGIECKIKANKHTRPRKKWGEEETNDLLQGVAMFGIGSWKKIMAHPGFKFNGRSSVDLKDRFRTCFPEEHRQHLQSASRQGSKAGNADGDCVHRVPISERNDSYQFPQQHALSDSASKSPSPRSHRKKPEDLARLGIEGPFPKSARRERRRFTKTEDEDLLRAFRKHGSAWKLMVDDSDFRLSSRRAMDLRDRFRNKYPKEYADAGYISRPPEFPRPPVRTEAEESAVEVNEPTSTTPTPKKPRTKKLHVLENPPGMSTKESPSNNALEPTEILQKPGCNSSYNSGNNAVLNGFNPSTITNSTTSTYVQSSTIFDWGDNILPPPPTNDNDTEFQRMLSHIHPLATWKASFNPLNLNPTSNKPLNTSGANVSITPFNTIPPTTLNLHPNNIFETHKVPLNLPPPTDLFSLDLDSSHPFHFPFKSSDPQRNSIGAADGGESRSSAGTAGGLEAQPALVWEDMATQPMFELDAGGGDGAKL